MCQNKIGCKITKKNPNAQIKLILFCHLQDFFTVISVGTLWEDRNYKKNDIHKSVCHFLNFLVNYFTKTPVALYI